MGILILCAPVTLLANPGRPLHSRAPVAGLPRPELQYILDHSEASLLLTSAKFAAKAQEVMATELASNPSWSSWPSSRAAPPPARSSSSAPTRAGPA